MKRTPKDFLSNFWGSLLSRLLHEKKYFAPKNIISKFELLKIIVRVKPLKLLAFNPLALQRNITSLFVIKVNEAILIRGGFIVCIWYRRAGGGGAALRARLLQLQQGNAAIHRTDQDLAVAGWKDVVDEGAGEADDTCN